LRPRIAEWVSEPEVPVRVIFALAVAAVETAVNVTL
jgi:hypothetical protein